MPKEINHDLGAYEKRRGIVGTMIDDVTVVIRASGERTLSRCQELIADEVRPDNVVVINEVPFSQAVRRTFELGLERGLPWTLAVDADILPRRGAILQLVTAANEVDTSTFEVQGVILDKLFGGFREGGPHLFRTSLCEAAVSHIPADGVSARPESFVLKSMAASSYPWKQTDLVIGLHDYEQFYSDIFRKAYTHAHKHARYAALLESLWTRLAEHDEDYKIALWGLHSGQIFVTEAKLDRREFPKDINSMLRFWGLNEKPSTVELSADDVDRIIAQYWPSDEYLEFIKRRDAAADGFSRRFGMRSRLRYVFEQMGPVKVLPWLAGKVLQRTGQKLLTWAENNRVYEYH